MSYWQSVIQEVKNKNDKNRAFMFTNFGSLSKEDDWLFEDDVIVKEPFKRDLRTYYLGEKYPDVYFTKREAECVFWLVRGLTLAESAQKMDLSPRTVEFYVKNMKQKLKCASKKRLIDAVLKTDLIDQLKQDGMKIVLH